MDVHQQHGEASTSSSMSVSTVEPTSTIGSGCKRNHSEIDDSDVDENTKNTPTTSDRFPKYMDFPKTLMELSFIKWLAGFRSECRKISCRTDTELYFGLLSFFCTNIAPEVEDCRDKPNKSSLLKSYLEQTLMFFRGYYKKIKKEKGDTLDVIYYDRMSTIVAYYLDLCLISFRCFYMKSQDPTVVNKLKTDLFVFLDQKFDYIFDSIFQSYLVLHYSKSFEPVMYPVCLRLLKDYPMPKKMNFLTYMRYILCFKLCKRLINCSLSMNNSERKIEQEILKSLLRKLNVPNDFMTHHEKYSWENCPKLTMSPNGTPDSIQKDLKNVSFILFGEKFPLKECYMDILNASRKNLQILLTQFQEQCKVLRPDLFEISGDAVLRNWNENFDDTLKPFVPTTYSCNSSVKKIKYNLYTPSKYECLEIDDKTDEVCIVPINDDLSKLKHLGEGSEDHRLRDKENFSHSDKKCKKKTNLINSSTNKIIDACNNDKSNENEKSSVDALKTLTLELFPANFKPQSNENEMQVNVKKSKSSEQHVLYRNGRFDPTLSNKPSRMNYSSEIKSTSHRSECSYSKESKRNQCSSFGENSKNKKICCTKSKNEKNVSNCNPNQIIDSNGHNSNSCRVILNNDNSVLENPKNSRNINGVSCLVNESLVKKKKWVAKASQPELSITADLNLKHIQSNFTVSDKDENIENYTKIIDLSSDQDGTASPSSNKQRPIKLSHSDSYSPELKPTIDNSEQMEIEPTSFDTERKNSPKTEHLLSLRNSEEMISKFISHKSINENENTQIYALPMDQKLSHIEHSYIENVMNSKTQYSEVVNVSSPVLSINSTDIPKNKSSWVQVVSPVHNLNDYNDIDCDHSQSSSQQLDGLCKSTNMNTSRVTNRNSEVELINNIQLETRTTPKHTNYHQKQKLKIYTDPTDMISVPNNYNTHSVIPINLNEAHVQKVFLGNKSPLQVHHSSITDSSVSSVLDLTNHKNIEDTSLIRLKNRQRICVNMCSNDKYIHPMLQPTDNDPNVKQTLINGYEGVLNQNLSMMNNKLMYMYPRSDSNTYIRYEKPPCRLKHKNPEHLSPADGLQYSSYDQILGPSFLEDSNQKEEKSSNTAHLMLQSSKYCKVHYKWPLNKTKSLTSSNVLCKYTEDKLNKKLSPNEILNQSTSLSFNERINNSTLIQPNQQHQNIYRNTKISSQSKESSPSFGFETAKNQKMLHLYVEEKMSSIEGGNCKNEQPTNTQISFSWKKHLAQRFTSAKDLIIKLPLNKDVNINSQHLPNACESYSDADDSNKSLNSEGPLCFIEDSHLHSYKYLQAPKFDDQNLLATSHQCDEEDFPNEINRYVLKNSLSSSFQSIDLNLTGQSLKYVHENTSNTSHLASAENIPSTSCQSTIGNLTSSSHQPFLNNFPSTSHGISLDSCFAFNDRGLRPNHMSHYSNGQMYTEFPHAYLKVSSVHIPNPSTISYYGSPIVMPSDNSVPFCSPNVSINSVSHSPSSDCSVPSLVETVTTAVLDHTLLDDSLEIINAAHSLMMISNRHRYKSVTSITKTTDITTVSRTATTNYETVTNVNDISPADITANNISLLGSNKNNISTTSFLSKTIQRSMTEPENQETYVVSQ